MSFTGTSGSKISLLGTSVIRDNRGFNNINIGDGTTITRKTTTYAYDFDNEGYLYYAFLKVSAAVGSHNVIPLVELASNVGIIQMFNKDYEGLNAIFNKTTLPVQVLEYAVDGDCIVGYAYNPPIHFRSLKIGWEETEDARDYSGLAAWHYVHLEEEF